MFITLKYNPRLEKRDSGRFEVKSVSSVRVISCGCKLMHGGYVRQVTGVLEHKLKYYEHRTGVKSVVSEI